MISFLALSTAALAADIDPITSEARYVDQSNSAEAVGLSTGSFAPGALVATWHAGKAVELYSALCVTVYSSATAGDVVKLGLYSTNASTDLPADLLWYGEVDASSTGRKCEAFADGTVTTAGAAFFNGAEDRLELDANDKIAKAAVTQGSAVTLRGPGSYATTTYGRFDNGSTDGKGLTSMVLSGVTGALPSSLSAAAPSGNRPPTIALEVY